MRQKLNKLWPVIIDLAVFIVIVLGIVFLLFGCNSPHKPAPDIDSVFIDPFMARGWPRQNLYIIPPDSTRNLVTMEYGDQGPEWIPGWDTAYVDNLMKDSADSPAAVNKPAWTIDSIEMLTRMMCRAIDLDDSAKDIYMAYLQQRATFRDYQRAYKAYSRYFLNVYEPMRKRDSAWAFSSK